MAYDAKTTDWGFKVTGLASGGAVVGGSILGVDIYSPETYFSGHARFYGIGIDMNAAFSINMYEGWDWITVKNAFSPRDLHGADGKLGVINTGLGVGGALMAISASFRGKTFFRNTAVGSLGEDVGFTFGTNMGVWLITSVYADPPVHRIGR